MGKLLFYNILLFIGGTQGLFLSIALLSKKSGNKKANHVFAALLFLFSFFILSHALSHISSQPNPTAVHKGLSHAVFFAVGPLLFFYSKALTQQDFNLKLRDLLHFLPAVIACILVISFSSAVQQSTLKLFINFGFLFLIAIQMIVYLVEMIFIVKKYSSDIKNTYSSVERMNLHWMRFLVTSQMIIWPIAFVADLYWHDSKDSGIMWLLLSVFIYVIAYLALLKPEIFSGNLQEDKIISQEGRKKYEKSALSAEQAETILQRLNKYMESSKPYIIPTLTLPSLSKEINISPHHLSQVINEKLNKNFFEYINQFRIEEAKRLLTDPRKKNLTLAAIGFEAGFNSVSSFNSIFKKATSYTPSQFQAFITKTTD